MTVNWRKELDFLLFLLVVGVVGWLAFGVMDVTVAYFNKVVTVAALLYGLLLLRNLVSWDDVSGKLYDAGVYSLFIVLSAFFLRSVFNALGISMEYAVYLEGFGYFLASAFILVASLIYIGKKLVKA